MTALAAFHFFFFHLSCRRRERGLVVNTSAQISGSSRDDAFQEPEKRPSLHSRTRAVGDVTSPHTRHTRTVTMKVAFKTLCVPDADARDP